MIDDRQPPNPDTARPYWRGFLLLLAVLGLASCGSEATAPPPDGDDPGNGGAEPYDHRRSAGASARDFLSDEDFQRLVVQVQYVEGHRPTNDALQHLEDFMAARLRKPAGIEIRLGEPLQIQTQETYTAAEARSLEEEHRTLYAEGDTLAAHLLFLNGEYAQDPDVIGIAYNNTSMAIFSGPIEEHTGGPTQPSRATVEAAVTLHELGHLLGLVDNGSQMQTPHRDEEHGHHCDDENCLMYYAVRTTDFIANLLGGDIPELDRNCLDDLAANGGQGG